MSAVAYSCNESEERSVFENNDMQVVDVESVQDALPMIQDQKDRMKWTRDYYFTPDEQKDMNVCSELDCYSIYWRRAWQKWVDYKNSQHFDWSSLGGIERANISAMTYCLDEEIRLSQDENSGLHLLWKLYHNESNQKNSKFLRLIDELQVNPAKFFDPQYDPKKVCQNPLGISNNHQMVRIEKKQLSSKDLICCCCGWFSDKKS